MKQNIKFYTTVISLLLVSFAILTGSMFAVAFDNAEQKPYDLSRQQNTFEGDNPLSQSTLQSKFNKMYEISEDNTTITVISQDYLNKYWQSNYEKAEIHSLSTEEVFYIIQDSIRIYHEYDKIILPGFSSLYSVKEIADRFPFVKEQEISSPDIASYLDENKLIRDIHTIILYRLKALSSPNAFFTAEEAMIHVGDNPKVYNGLYPATLLYIANYSEHTDRDKILSAYGNKESAPFDFDVFGVALDGIVPRIHYCDGSGTPIFPTQETLLCYSTTRVS